MSAQIVFVTEGTAVSVFSTISPTPFFTTGGESIRFLNTIQNTSVFQTDAAALVFLNTVQQAPVFQTPSLAVSFFQTVETGTNKLLKLRIGTLVFTTDGTQVDVPDATGVYNPTTNPGGYNPDGSPPVPGRPERTDVDLWTVYRIWSKPASEGYGINTQLPDTQPTPQEDPYIYTLTLPTEQVDGETEVIRGLYEIILIAAPEGLQYDPFFKIASLAAYAEQTPNWYKTGVGVMVDSVVQNCLNRMRYEFLQSVMCGKCNEAYLEVYGLYVGMLNAMESGQWTTAVAIYDKLKEICSSQEQSCTC